MEVSKSLFLIFLQILHFSSICLTQHYCEVEKQNSGEIYYSTKHNYEKCWKIEVPVNNSVLLNVKELKSPGYGCAYGFVNISVADTGEVFQFCHDRKSKKPVFALNDAYVNYRAYERGYSIIFRINYHIETLICLQKYHFRCSKHYCISQDKVCDGIKDCENGDDEKECEKLICLTQNHFRCTEMFCVQQNKVCDGVKDCENGADERGCENLVCLQKNHFRCSNDSCILQHKVCDGVKDCENGADEEGCETGEDAASEVDISRENSIAWLQGQRSASFGWGSNTHRAVTALYLAGAADFQGYNMDEELMAKQLELQTSVAIMRNSTDPLSVSDLSMFVDALTVTCHNPSQFYGYDLLHILEERLNASKSPSPAAFLTLCNSNRTFSVVHLKKLLRILDEHSEYPFHLDVQAVTVMALACVKNKMKNIDAAQLYEAPLQKLIRRQLPDGSFGNVYTTALVTQALLSNGQENNELWNFNSTMKYLMKELNTSADFLSTYLTLPIFSGKSLVDIGKVNCTNFRKHGEVEDISDVTNKILGKVRIQYSLYVGDKKDVIHTIYLRVPGNSSAYEVMKLAQVVDHKYKFQHRDVSGHMYVYAIAGITNDAQADKFWILYTGDSDIDGAVHHRTKSPDKFILGDGEHLIMWYKSVHV